MQVRQSVTHSSTDSNSLHDQIAKAIAKAQITGSPILFSYSQNWECSNPLLLLASKTDPKQAKFYWEQPTADLVLAGAGAVAEISVPNHNLSDRFACAKQFMKAHLDNALIVQHPAVVKSEIPIHIFGAFSFYHSNNQTNDWLDLQSSNDQPVIEFPTLLFFIPRWMVRHCSKNCTLRTQERKRRRSHSDTSRPLARGSACWPLAHWRHASAGVAPLPVSTSVPSS
jgi:menaquinone-specific isochorismate synthase